jgi:hypothetical protein
MDFEEFEARLRPFALNGPVIQCSPGFQLNDPLTASEDDLVQVEAELQTRLCRRLQELSNSFTAGTQVLMEDRSTKPIEQIRPGDRVMAGDPEAGEGSPEAGDGVVAGGYREDRG